MKIYKHFEMQVNDRQMDKHNYISFVPSSDLQAGAKLVLNRQFADERWTKNRVVTCLDWSPQVSVSTAAATLAEI